MANKNTNGVNVVSETGSPMMTLESFGREGDKMTIQGALMGSWSSKMYVAPEEVLPMIGLLLKWDVIGYMLSLPVILLRRKFQRGKE